MHFTSVAMLYLPIVLILLLLCDYLVMCCDSVTLCDVTFVTPFFCDSVTVT